MGVGRGGGTSYELAFPRLTVAFALALVPPAVGDHLVMFHEWAAVKEFTSAHDCARRHGLSLRLRRVNGAGRGACGTQCPLERLCGSCLSVQLPAELFIVVGLC